MPEKKKKKLSEKQKEVLAKNNFKNKTPAERRRLGAKGAAKTNKIKAEKIARSQSKDWAWEQYGKAFLEDIAQNGTPKEKAEIIKALFPNDKQMNELSGGVSIEKIFITQEEKQATDKHIDDVINDAITE